MTREGGHITLQWWSQKADELKLKRGVRGGNYMKIWRKSSSGRADNNCKSFYREMSCSKVDDGERSGEMQLKNKQRSDYVVPHRLEV